MKTTISKIRNIMTALIMISCMSLNGQVTKKTCGVLNIYSSGTGLTNAQIGTLLRSEVEKLDTFEMMDRFDMDYLIKQKGLNAECNSKLCLVEIGKALNSDKMFSGSVELIGEQIVVTLHLIDVSEGAVEKTKVEEFLNLPTEIKTMMNITVCEMFGKPVDATLKTSLTRKNTFDNAINNPTVSRLNCSGPRMGATFFTGDAAKVINAAEIKGGYDGYPAMFQFGYQWEKQYLNEGSFQALFEFVPLVTGLDQGRFIPSLTIMNGIRNNKSGWEFAFGPTIMPTRQADGYYDESGWHLRNEWGNDSLVNPYPIVTRLDSRGYAHLTSGFVFAFGKTIKSGNLNIPVNAFIIPNKQGIRFGISFGYNSKK